MDPITEEIARKAMVKVERRSTTKPDQVDKEIGEGTVAVAAEPKASDETKKINAPAPTNTPEIVKRTQGIIASIHDRRQERARLVAEGNSKRVRYQNETDADQKALDTEIARMEKECEQREVLLCNAFKAKVDLREAELQGVTARIEKVDVSLEQLRKQLDVELGKLDPDRKAVTG